MKTNQAPGRAVLLIHRLISKVAPPLHSLHWKIFLLCLAAVFLPGLFFAWKVGQGIERSHLRSTEQGMIDTALVLGETWSRAPLADLPNARETMRRVFSDLSPNLRIVLYSPEGKVLHDTEGILPPAADQSQERDVAKAVKGGYGSRWDRDTYRRVVVLYSTIPVMKNGTIIGLVGVIKTTADVRKSVIRSLKDLAGPALLAFLLAALVSYALSSYLTGIIGGLARQAERVAAGEPGVRLETWTRSELGDLSRALEKMRAKLEGREYVEEMAVTLSHELKTPIAAIRGAAEILEQELDPGVRRKFLANIALETGRLESIVTNFLALSRIESAPADPAARADVARVAGQAAEVFQRRAGDIRFEVDLSAAEGLAAPLPPDQLLRLLEALLENAFQFTPAGGAVSLAAERNGLVVSDTGPGIPPELRDKVFDRFFTTVNPRTGRRGTGLGLAIVKSLSLRYGLEIRLESTPGNGTSVRVGFPGVS